MSITIGPAILSITIGRSSHFVHYYREALSFCFSALEVHLGPSVSFIFSCIFACVVLNLESPIIGVYACSIQIHTKHYAQLHPCGTHRNESL